MTKNQPQKNGNGRICFPYVLRRVVEIVTGRAVGLGATTTVSQEGRAAAVQELGADVVHGWIEGKLIGLVECVLPDGAGNDERNAITSAMTVAAATTRAATKSGAMPPSESISALFTRSGLALAAPKVCERLSCC
jgi:hypothetical protein